MEFITDTKKTAFKRLAALILVLAVLAGLPAVAYAAYEPQKGDYSVLFWIGYNAWPSHHDEADALNFLGLFLGTDAGYDLNRAPTRIEALVTVIRLMGKESEAFSQKIEPTFIDIPAWAVDYAGYAQEHKIVMGLGDGRFGSNDLVTARQYATMILRVLGYDDRSGDFSYDSSLKFCAEIGLISDRELDHYLKDSSKMLRDDIVHFMYCALGQEISGSKKPLVLDLIEMGAVDRYLACASLLDENESESEILRALKNGYSEKWLKDICAIIDGNKNIPVEFKAPFKDSIYNWLKEPGTNYGISQMKTKLEKLNVSTRAMLEDVYLTQNPQLAGYYSYPNRIVIRSDLSQAVTLSSLSHELRHAMTGSIEISTLEEGMTDYWNQEVDGGLYAYEYYYINAIKLLTHIIGARAINESHLKGDYENIFYELERKAGVRLDKIELKALLSKLHRGDPTDADLKAVAAHLFKAVKGYYENNFGDIVADSSGYEEFIDTLIALAQLLYYPSAAIQRVESDVRRASASSYYAPEYGSFADDMIARYSDETGEELALLSGYYGSNKNTRYCREYLGSGAGNMFVKNATAYEVVFKRGNRYYYEVFGTKRAADRFSKLVDVVSISEMPGAAFGQKAYVK